MSETYFRIQMAERDVAELLDPANQISYHWAGGEFDDDARARRGVSVCDSLESLASYLAVCGIPFGLGDWVVVELEGYRSDDDPYDAEHGEYLIHPTAIVSVTEFGEEFLAMVGAAYDAQQGE